MQELSSVFQWINEQPKDCVVLVKGKPNSPYYWNGLIPAFTHCNIYNSAEVFSLLPTERIYHNYLTYLFFNGVSADGIEEYLQNHAEDAKRYLFTHWKEIYGVTQFPDFIESALAEKKAKIPVLYREYLTSDMRAQLQTYKLNYILVEGELLGPVADFVDHFPRVFMTGDISIYEFNFPQK